MKEVKEKERKNSKVNKKNERSMKKRKKGRLSQRLQKKKKMNEKENKKPIQMKEIISETDEEDREKKIIRSENRNRLIRMLENFEI